MCEAHRHQQPDSHPAAVAGQGIRVDDMTCGHCAATITSAIEASLPGTKVSADPATRLVSVAGADPAKVREIIVAAGYTPEPLSA